MGMYMSPAEYTFPWLASMQWLLNHMQCSFESDSALMTDAALGHALWQILRCLWNHCCGLDSVVHIAVSWSLLLTTMHYSGVNICDMPQSTTTRKAWKAAGADAKPFVSSTVAEACL